MGQLKARHRRPDRVYVRETLAITDRAYILHDGRILASGTATELANNPKAREIYLGEKFSL